jgi:hypothetical protein
MRWSLGVYDYSPPFDTVTEDLWSIIILYIDSRFLYTQEESKKWYFFVRLKICIPYCFRGLVLISEINFDENVKMFI